VFVAEGELLAEREAGHKLVATMHATLMAVAAKD
jgi:hypothetical protein